MDEIENDEIDFLFKNLNNKGFPPIDDKYMQIQTHYFQLTHVNMKCK